MQLLFKEHVTYSFTLVFPSLTSWHETKNIREEWLENPSQMLILVDIFAFGILYVKDNFRV